MNAIFVMSTRFPFGEAYSSRARNLTKLICNCGYHVHIVAPKSDGKEKADELDEFDYSVSYVRAPKNIMTLSGIGTAKPYLIAIKKYLKINKVDLIVSSSMIFVADYLLKLARKLNVPYIIEQCEWFDASTFKYGKWNPYYREHVCRIEKKNRKVDGVIAISRLLEQHYSFQGVSVIRIPTILDIKNTEYRIERKDGNEYRIVFAGSLGKGKEKMAPIFQALVQANRANKKIILDIYGPSQKEIIDNINNDMNLWQEVNSFVNIYGYIPQNEVMSVVRKADFTVFTRPIRKSSNAGFPTKLAESMAVGTPVITNDTGDIGMYLQDKKNGFLLENGCVEEIFNAFNTIVSLNDFQYKNMRKCVRKTAEESFDYRIYLEKMKEFLLRFE